MQVLGDASKVDGMIQSLTDWVGLAVADHPNPEGWALVGLKSRGDVIAERVAASLGAGTFNDNVGSLDITLYRDDLSEIGPQPVVQTTDIPFSLDGLDVMLIDDVLMSGRTIRAALQALVDFGRPRRVWLAVLADRGGRELPIQPDFAALDLTDRPGTDKIKLRITPIHDVDELLSIPAPSTRG